MKDQKLIACVTGASGMVGIRIAERLIQENYYVRVLSRKASYPYQNVEHFQGGLEDESLLSEFLKGAQSVFHCAAEKRVKKQMWAVNVDGTERLVRVVNSSKIESFCHVSSAGVVGSTKHKWIDENVSCRPQNLYEKSKWEAEKIVRNQLKNCRVIILRPANIFNNTFLGILKDLKSRSAKGFLIRLVNGREAAHLIHAIDVAAAAVYLTEQEFKAPNVFFVACDEDPLNSIEGIFKVFKDVRMQKGMVKSKAIPSLPLWVPYAIRTLRRGKGNPGDVRYSSAKLLSTGFRYPIGFRKAVKNSCRFQMGIPTDDFQKTEKDGAQAALNSVTILGGSGFIGRHLIRKLSKQMNTDLKVLIHRNEINHLDFPGPVRFIKGDILDKDTLLKVIKPGETVVNLVRLAPESRHLYSKVIECIASVCAERHARRLIHCSTVNVVGNFTGNHISENTPCNPKGGINRLNLELEKELRINASGRFDMVILRPTLVFGVGGQNLKKMIKELKAKHWLLKYLRSCLNFNRRMNLVGVDNVVEAIGFLIKTDEPINQKIFIISDDEDPNNNYRYIEKAIMRATNTPKYPLPLIPMPSIFIQMILILFNKEIFGIHRNYDWQRLKDAGYIKNLSFTEALDQFLSKVC